MHGRLPPTPKHGVRWASCPSIGFIPLWVQDLALPVQDSVLVPRHCSPLVAALADALAWGVALAAVVARAGARGDTEPPVLVEPRRTLAATGAVLAA